MDTAALQLPAHAVALLAALACGLVVGLERGWRDRERAEGGRVAGLRTFALVGLMGGVFSIVGPAAAPWLLAAGALGLAVLAVVSYREAVHSTGSLSATSSVALLLTYGLGALAGSGAPALALSAAVVVAVLLDLRPTLHRWLRLIEHRELSAALQMLVLSAVVLPLLPDAAYGPYGTLNPYRLWWAVVLIAGLSMSGHIAMRLAGAQRGALWTGLLGGLASSTAATLALARQARAQPVVQQAALAGALSACAVMFLRIAVVLLSLAPALGLVLLLPLLACGAVLFAIALRQWRRRPEAPATTAAADLRPFDLGTALGFGAFLALMSVLAEASQEWLGATGLYGLSLLSGVADVDAITVSVARMAALGSVPGAVAAVAVALAVASNVAVKAAIGWVIGGARFGRHMAAAQAAALLAGAAVLGLVLGVG